MQVHANFTRKPKQVEHADRNETNQSYRIESPNTKFSGTKFVRVMPTPHVVSHCIVGTCTYLPVKRSGCSPLLCQWYVAQRLILL